VLTNPRKALLAVALAATVLGALVGYTASTLNQPDVPAGTILTACDAKIPAGIPSKEIPDVEDLCPEPTQPDASVGIIPPDALSAAEKVKGEGAVAGVEGDFGSPAVYSNGRLPGAILCKIPGVGPQLLRCDAARAWNAMYAAARLSGIAITPCGGYCSYRPLFAQFSVRSSACARGRCYMAAVPGTSNHGLGIAVDLGDGGRGLMRRIIDRIGARFGWAKRCSDASWEPWHLKFNPACTGATSIPPIRPRCHSGSVRVRGRCWFVIRPRHARGHARAVKLAQRRLHRHCLHTGRYGHFDRRTRAAVRRLKRGEHIGRNAVVGKSAWRRLFQKGRC
jgi:hypothetical protein